MKKSKFIKYFLIFLIFAFFSGIAVIAIIISRGGLITNEGIQLNSGTIRITTDPKDLKYKAFLNNQEVQPQDNQLRGLNTSNYNLRIEVQGYALWEKDLKVTEGFVTDVFAKLYPTNLAIEQFTKTNVDKAFFSQNGEYVYYLVKDTEFGNEKGIWRLKLNPSQVFLGTNQTQPEKISNIFVDFVEAINSGKYELNPSPDNNKLLFKDLNAGLNYLLNVNGANDSITSLESELGFTADALFWFNTSNSLIVKKGPVLFEQNLSNKLKVLIKYSQDSPIIYSVNNNQVVYFDETKKQIMVYKNQAAEALKVVNIELPKDITSLNLAANSERFIILGTVNGYKYLDVEKSLLKDIPGVGQLLSFSNEGRSALFIDANKAITAYTVSELIALNTVEIKVTPTGLVMQAGDLIFFTPITSHLLYYDQANSSIFVLDKDGGNKTELLKNSGIQPYFNFDTLGENLFVLLTDETDAVNNGSNLIRSNIYKINLLKPQK